MRTEQEQIAYFEDLASKHKSILHESNKKAFFYIHQPDDLDEFDEGLKAMAKNTAMLLTASDGNFSDNQSNSYVDTINFDLYIILRKKTALSNREINAEAKRILISVLGRIRKENPTRFQINANYTKVGPMHDEWFGYMVSLSMPCPFGFTVDSGNWTDQ